MKLLLEFGQLLVGEVGSTEVRLMRLKLMMLMMMMMMRREVMM